MLKCRWCGEQYEQDASVDRAADGFWCDCCDGFTHFAVEVQERHRMLLLLENSSPKETSANPGELPPQRLRKRLSPLRYPGGKSKMIDFLYAQMLSGFTDTFVEVFAGGASLGLSLLDAGAVGQLVLNDADPFVYAFWDTCLHRPEYLCQRIDAGTPTLADFWTAKAIVAKKSNGEPVPPDECAWAFFLLNRTAFSGIIFANPMSDMLARWNPDRLKERIQSVAKLADRITLCNQDCNDFLSESAYWLPNCTLFVDPPYVEKADKLYASSFVEEDHRRLAELLNLLHMGMDGPDIIITYDNHPLVRELYPFAECRTVGRIYSV